MLLPALVLVEIAGIRSAPPDSGMSYSFWHHMRYVMVDLSNTYCKKWPTHVGEYTNVMLYNMNIYINVSNMFDVFVDFNIDLACPQAPTQ